MPLTCTLPWKWDVIQGNWESELKISVLWDKGHTWNQMTRLTMSFDIQLLHWNGYLIFPSLYVGVSWKWLRLLLLGWVITMVINIFAQREENEFMLLRLRMMTNRPWILRLNHVAQQLRIYHRLMVVWVNETGLRSKMNLLMVEKPGGNSDNITTNRGIDDKCYICRRI